MKHRLITLMGRPAVSHYRYAQHSSMMLQNASPTVAWGMFGGCLGDVCINISGFSKRPKNDIVTKQSPQQRAGPLPTAATSPQPGAM